MYGRMFRPFPSCIVVMLQALACTPGVRVALLRWAKQDNLKFRTPVRSSEVLPPEIHPLDEDELWPFATWALAAQVASKFVSQFRSMSPWRSILRGTSESSEAAGSRSIGFATGGSYAFWCERCLELADNYQLLLVLNSGGKAKIKVTKGIMVLIKVVLSVVFYLQLCCTLYVIRLTFSWTAGS